MITKEEKSWDIVGTNLNVSLFIISTRKKKARIIDYKNNYLLIIDYI